MPLRLSLHFLLVCTLVLTVNNLAFAAGPAEGLHWAPMRGLEAYREDAQLPEVNLFGLPRLSADLEPTRLPPTQAAVPRAAVPQDVVPRAAARTVATSAPARLASHGLSTLGKPHVRTQTRLAGQPVVFQSPEVLPIDESPRDDSVALNTDSDLVTLIATGADLPVVLRMIAEDNGMNLVLGPGVAGSVTVSIRDARLEEVLDAILGVAGFNWNRVDNLLYVTGNAVENMDPRVHGRTVQVYPLSYTAAVDVEGVVNGLLSNVGQAFATTSDSADQLKSRELMVVEDTASAHQRIRELLAQVDRPPRQVLIEAHVLQIVLDNDERHGVNLSSLARVGNANIELKGTGFADTASSPSLALSVDGTDMDGLIECIRRNTNSRTLASPKLSVVNNQTSKIQIGERLPFSVSTTTQTTTVQSVDFLEVGIVLSVTPTISEDGNVLMTVLPKVSGGKIGASGFPEEETTEVSTTIMIPDGGGVVIGGLIREESVENLAGVPGLQRIPLLGRLFRRTTSDIRRTELIVALVAHILPTAGGPRSKEYSEIHTTLPPYALSELNHAMDHYVGPAEYSPSIVAPAAAPEVEWSVAE